MIDKKKNLSLRSRFAELDLAVPLDDEEANEILETAGIDADASLNRLLQKVMEATMTRRVVIISGTRHLRNAEPLRQPLEVLDLCSNDVVLHGNAKGVDKLAAELVSPTGASVVACDADWDRYGKRAGPKRNHAMAEIANELVKSCGYKVVVIAFPGPKSIGTRGMIRVAERA